MTEGYQPQTLRSDQQHQIKEDLALMKRKEVYPYEYMNSFEQFQEHPKTRSKVH